MRCILLLLLCSLFLFGCVEQADQKIDQIAAWTDIVTDLHNEYGEDKVVKNKEIYGVLFRDQVWAGNITVLGDIILPERRRLTILPGTVIKIQPYRGYKNPDDRIEFFIAGDLTIKGEENNKVKFTSAALNPQNGDWGRLFLQNTNAQINHTIFEFGIQGVSVLNSKALIENSIIRWNNYEGIYLEDNANATIKKNLIYQNGYNCIAMELYSTAYIEQNEIRECGTIGIHVDASNATVIDNSILNNINGGISIDNHAYLIAENNTVLGYAGFSCGEGQNEAILIKNNISSVESCYTQFERGNGSQTQINYEDDYELGYIPGDANLDLYEYISDEDDETRHVINKFGNALGLTWSVAVDDFIWTANLDGKLFQLTKQDEIVNLFDVSPQPWGMTILNNNLFINDFSERKIYEYDKEGNLLNSFKLPREISSAKGLDNDGRNLLVMGWSEPTIYRLSTNGRLIGKVELDKWATGGIAYDGEYYWVPCDGICKFNKRGRYLGRIYSASDGTWGLDYYNNSLYATQRTNENWLDKKIFEIKIKKLVD